jgi:4-hydroxy-tetrahydrodipicolinate synthase
LSPDAIASGNSIESRMRMTVAAKAKRATPAISPPGLPLDQLNKLPIQGIKDSSLDPRRLLAELDLFHGPIYTGADSLLSYAGPLGCTRALGALANVEPELSIAAFQGDATAQRRLAPIERTALEQFPLGLKKLMHEQFGTSIRIGKGIETPGRTNRA